MGFNKVAVNIIVIASTMPSGTKGFVASCVGFYVLSWCLIITHTTVESLYWAVQVGLFNVVCQKEINITILIIMARLFELWAFAICIQVGWGPIIV